MPVVLLLCLYWMALAVGAHIPHKVQHSIFPFFSDFLLHFLAFFGLGFLAAWATARMWNGNMLSQAISFVAVCLFATVSELTQGLTGRICDIYDLLYGMSGAFFGCLLYSVLARIFQSAKDKTSPPSKDASD